MKVKKNSLFLIIGAVVFLTAGWIIILSYPFQSITNFYSQGEDYVSKGLALKSFYDIDLDEYYTKNQDYYDVLHYDLHFDIDTPNKILGGDVTIKAVPIKDKLNQIDLNFYENLNIILTEINGKKVSFERDDTHLFLQPVTSLNDTFFIRIIYKGEPEKLGFGSFDFGEYKKSSVVYTLSEPVFASTWFPCKDIPNDKATADIWITNDSSQVSISNGILEDVTTQRARRTYHWKTEYQTSTYLLAIFSGDYKTFSQKYFSINSDTLDLDYYAFPQHLENAKKDFDFHPEAINIFENLFGEYPFTKEKYGVAEFLWESGAMENQTITGIGEKYVSGRNFFRDMLVHELAHQWWGNAVGLQSWKDIWLNEGFATYSEALYYEKLSGHRALISTMQSKYGRFDNTTLYDPGYLLFTKTIYNKGAWVLHMLRYRAGDDYFFEILRNYYSTFKYKNASTGDFKRICEKVTGIDLRKFFDEWVYKGIGKIKLEYDWTVNKSAGIYQVEINLKQTQSGYDTYEFPLEIKFVKKGISNEKIVKFDISKKNASLTAELNYVPDKIVLDPGTWLLADFYEIDSKSE